MPMPGYLRSRPATLQENTWCGCALKNPVTYCITVSLASIKLPRHVDFLTDIILPGSLPGPCRFRPVPTEKTAYQGSDARFVILTFEKINFK